MQLIYLMVYTSVLFVGRSNECSVVLIYSSGVTFKTSISFIITISRVYFPALRKNSYIENIFLITIIHINTLSKLKPHSRGFNSGGE